MMIEVRLLEKYNVPVPRYTSYPTVPYWHEGLDAGRWRSGFSEDFAAVNSTEGISLYLHLPFCESMCTYCGCNKKITANHAVETEYMDALLKEWAMYRSLMPEKPVIRELHLGGGTPTFFAPERLAQLVSAILADADVHPEHEFSFEGHPNNTTRGHLEQLYKVGFRRVSFGVQDNDPEVQRTINRMQPIENVQYVTDTARATGYKSVNFDLIYGLPRQTLDSITRTIEQTIALRPDRVAFYSYAHVPWTSRGQRLFDEFDLPSPQEKIKLYHAGKRLFAQHGYEDIGMDHFALPGDDLYKAAREGILHRNFMGYTTQQTSILLGLGVSSISSTGRAYAQNAKTLHNYYEYVNAGKPAVEKGCFLTDEDRRFARYILDISCRGKTIFQAADRDTISEYCLPALRSMEDDGLVVVDDDSVSVLPLGRSFIRNICSAFDLYLQRQQAGKDKRMFSNAI